MRAVCFSRRGPAADVLEIRDLPTPEPAAGEVRVRLVTSGINPSDVKRRAAPAGEPAEFARVIPHSDGAGVIDKIGDDVDPARDGQRVWLYNAQWLRADGTAAEYIVVPQELAVPLPESVDFAAAASFGIPALTAYYAANCEGPVNGKTLLVQGGAGAVAFYAIQCAKAAGATVITTVSSPEKAAYAQRAGADVIIDYKREPLAERIAALTDARGVDRIIEVDLAANAMSYPSILAEHGTAIVYGTSGPQVTIPAAFIRQSTTLRFFIVYSLSAEERASAIAALETLDANGRLDHGTIRRFAFDDVVAAHEAVEAGGIGNVVLTIGQAP